MLTRLKQKINQSNAHRVELRAVKARFVIVITIFIWTIIATPLLGIGFVIRPATILLSISFMSNIISLIWIFIGKKLQYRRYFAMFFDVTVITVTMHYIGGIETPLSLIYVAVITAYALLFGFRVGILIAAVSSLMFSCLIFMEFKGVLTHVNFNILRPEYLHTDKFYLYLRLFSDNLIFFGTASVSGLLSEHLHRKKNELQKSNEEILKMQATLQQYTGELEKDVMKRTEDLTRANEELRQSEQKFRSLVELTTDWIWETDQYGIYTYASPRVKEVLGYDPEEIVGKTVFDLIPANEAEQTVNFFIERARSQESVRAFENTNLHKNGRRVLVESSGMPILDASGNLLGYRGVDRDITGRRQAEEELRNSEERLKILFEYAPDAYYLNDFEGRFVDGNKAAEELIGYKKEELVGKSFLDLNLLPADQLAKAAKHLLENAEGKITGPDELILNRKDGKQVTVEIRTFPVRIGNQVLALGSARDVTERKRLQQQLFQAQKMESIGTLAGGIAHDFNNLLGGILGYASFMKTKMTKEHPFFTYIDTVESSATRAADLTAQLLAFARGGKYETKPVNLNSIVVDTLKIISRTFNKSIEIKTHLYESLPTVEADAGQMQQMLMNLCVNANDAMPNGGQLIIETDVRVLGQSDVGMHEEAAAGSYVVISVTDTGVGMDKETVTRIFEPFFTTKEKGKGTGLGLSMVYGVVKNHSGSVNVYTEPGVGSTFKVCLPVSGKPEPKELSDAKKPLGGNESILIVDDELSIRSLARDMLESSGYSVLLADNGEKAIEVYKRHNGNIKLVILDMVMPKMGGRETFLKLKELNPKVKALLSTGYSQSGKAQEILDSGVMGFVQKPYRVNTLLSEVRNVLDAKTEA